MGVVNITLIIAKFTDIAPRYLVMLLDINQPKAGIFLRTECYDWYELPTVFYLPAADQALSLKYESTLS